MMRLEKNIDFTTGYIVLPTSKSLSNRALIIRELAGKFTIDDLSDADDTQNLLSNLQSTSETIDIGAAGTNMRFLISLFCATGKQKKITGSERMLQRPIGKLVDALRSLGACITYDGSEGFPPVVIHPQIPLGGHVSIDGSESSQFISSMLMIAPVLKNGMIIKIIHGSASASYIQMTMDLMKYFGVKCEMNDHTIVVKPQSYIPRDYRIEGDWSAAGSWYGFIAASKKGVSLVLENLALESLQGDKKAVDHFKKLGVETTIASKGVRIEKKYDAENDLHFDLINEPDLFPGLAFTCATLKLTAKFTGLQTLNLKESKRIEAIALELSKTGVIPDLSENHFSITGYEIPLEKIIFSTYHDHRIAMAASIYCMTGTSVTIENTEVVTKSYPQYWEHLKNIRIANIY